MKHLEINFGKHGLNYLKNNVFIANKTSHSAIVLISFCFRSKWFNNPHFNGTYSFPTIASNVEGSSCIEALSVPIVNSQGQPILQFAGEATSPDHFSNVHGAVDSGFREAKRIIQYYNSKWYYHY